MKVRKRMLRLFRSDNRSILIPIDSKPIDHLRVEVCSGDEICTIFYVDRSRLVCDSNPYGRLFEVPLGTYTVPNEYIDRWLQFKTDIRSKYLLSEERAFMFCPQLRPAKWHKPIKIIPKEVRHMKKVCRLNFEALTKAIENILDGYCSKVELENGKIKVYTVKDIVRVDMKVEFDEN